MRVEAAPYAYPVVGSFKFLRPDRSGRVVRPSVLIRLTDADGRIGWGQAVPMPSWTYETVETVMSTLAEHLAEALLGADPESIDEIHERMNRAIRPAFSTGQPLCKAGVDIACHDLAAKQRGCSVAELLGGVRQDSLTLSWTVAAADLDEVGRLLEEGRALGYRNFNIKVGPPQSLEYDLLLARTVREFAPDGFLWADANTGYEVEEALEAAPKLADAGVDVLESPLPPNRIRGYQRLRRQGALPILMDEGILSPVEAEEFAALGMLDGIAMKPARSAGLAPSKKIIEGLQEAGLWVLGSGLTDPDLSLAASLHLFGWAGIQKPCALNGPQFLEGFLAEGALAPTEGRFLLPKGDGLGIEPVLPEGFRLTLLAEKG